MGTFAQEFMRIYDRKIASGEITFSRSGITAGDFTALCMNGQYVIPEDRLQVVFDKMRMTQQERQRLLACARQQEET